jgi:hypothetical protein
MKDEIQVRMKHSYWTGVLDTLNTHENPRSDKFVKEKITAETWLVVLDWILGQSEESSSEVDKPGQ